MRLLTYLSLWVLIGTACTPAKRVHLIRSNEKTIDYRVNDLKGSWTIMPELYPDRLEVVCREEQNSVAFISDVDSIAFDIMIGDTVRFTVEYEQQHALTEVIGVSKPAHFSPNYIETHRGQYEMLVPEVHELVNILVALSDIGRLDSNLVSMHNSYYQEVMTHFRPFQQHPVFDSLNQYLTAVRENATYTFYFNIRMNSFAYVFNAKGEIVNEGIYAYLGFDANNQFEAIRELINDFAETSDFRKFYLDHQAYYSHLQHEYRRLAPIDKMWSWVEAKFPLSIDCYKIIFSPLAGSAHASQQLSDQDYTETLLYVNLPKTIHEPLSEQEKEALLSRIVFTELDHNYVNPTSDQYDFNHSIMHPLNCWNNQMQGHGSSYATFNEYMTWGIYSLYMFDQFSPEVFKNRIRQESRFMERNRGFTQFSAFNQQLIQLYQQQEKGAPLTDLFEPMMLWTREFDCEP